MYWVTGRKDAHTYPVDRAKPYNVHHAFYNDQEAAPARFCRVCLPHRSSGSVQAVADASDDPSNDHLRQRVRRCLQGCSDGHDRGTDDDCTLASEVISINGGGDGAQKAANVVDCGGDADEFRLASDAM